MRVLSLLFVVAITCVSCKEVGKTPAYHESIKQQWKVTGAADPEALVSFTIALTHDRVKLRRKFLSVSDPKSEDYKNYWTPQQLCAATSPSAQSIGNVLEFLGEHNLRKVDTNRCGDALYCEGRVSDVQLAFNTGELQHFTAVDAPQKVIVASRRGVRIPDNLASHIDVIEGLHFPGVKPAQVATPDSAPPITIASPTNLKVLYEIPAPADAPTSGSAAAAGWEHQSFSVHDLKAFQQHYKLPLNPINKVFGHNTGFPHGESNLDTQTLTGIYGGKTDYFLNPGLASFDVLDWLFAVGNQTNPALVWSVSYGEDLDAIKVDYARRCDVELQKLATLGLSVLIASGDSGANSRSSGKKFAAEFPASLPSCTAVGASVLNKDGTETQAVGRSFGWSSGGGFSYPAYFNQSAAPWQASAVANYLATAKLPPASDWANEKGGVGFPDIAAVGSNHWVYEFFIPQPIAGTSASCPTASGIVALLNGALLDAGKKPLGFLNPLFYANAALFHDITIGNTGWFAAKGWDATTGLGTFRYPAFLKLVMNSTK